VDSETYTGPTKKGVRFAWDKLTEFIGLLETQARQLGSGEKAKPVLFTDAHPGWVKDTEKVGADKGHDHSSVVTRLNGIIDMLRSYGQPGVQTGMRAA
jgi:hypothetical protein